MTNRARRAALKGAAAAIGGWAIGSVAMRSIAPALAQGDDERVIEIVARRFSFTPNEITVKRGQPLLLAISSIDFMHGFNVPDLGLRADLVPGRVTQVRLTPVKEGPLYFLCDNFCGDGHEGMNGKFIVQEA
jgi:cytochrome c oxidase subunit 2